MVVREAIVRQVLGEHGTVLGGLVSRTGSKGIGQIAPDQTDGLGSGRGRRWWRGRHTTRPLLARTVMAVVGTAVTRGGGVAGRLLLGATFCLVVGPTGCASVGIAATVVARCGVWIHGNGSSLLATDGGRREAWTEATPVVAMPISWMTVVGLARERFWTFVATYALEPESTSCIPLWLVSCAVGVAARAMFAADMTVGGDMTVGTGLKVWTVSPSMS